LSKFRIFKTSEFQKALARLPAAQSAFLENKLNAHVYPQFRQQPYFGPNIKKLRGYSPETWRYRLGRYRLFYLVDGDERIIYLLTLDDRKDAHR
jgi:mRNA interferase RelE/StbE